MNSIFNNKRANMVMNTMKSSTQVLIEQQEHQEILKNYVRDFVEHYDTHNMILGLDGNTPKEIVEGFFEVSYVSSNLEEALKNMKFGESIQILGLESDRQYRNGVIRKTISECNTNSTIVNIRNFEIIEK